MTGIYVWKNRLKKFIDHPMAVFPFVKKRLFYNFIADRHLNYYRDFKYLDYEQTLNEIINNDRSIVRFGDELFDMLQGIGLYYGDWHQKYDKKLASRLIEVITSRNPKLLVCFNPELILKTKQDFAKEGISEQYHFWTNSKIFLKDYYHKDVVYGSALCFNPKYNLNIDFAKIKNYLSTKNIIIITSKTDRLRNMKGFGKTLDFIEAPKNNAWQLYNEIQKTLMRLISTKNYNRTDTLIMISMGSAAKILVFDLTQKGFTAWDTGQFFDLAYEKIKSL